MTRYPRRGPKYQAPSHEHFLVAVDLGKTKLGVAVFLEDQLCWASTVRSPRGSDPGTVATHTMAAILRGVPDWDLAPGASHWVCEWPQKYGTARKFYKSIDSLYAVGCAIGQLNSGWSEKYPPFAWKGNVPKVAHHRRLRRELTNLELKTMKDQGHDAWDAVGIGLYALGRTYAGGVR